MGIVHPDGGRRKHGKDFVQLKKDYDEARAMMLQNHGRSPVGPSEFSQRTSPQFRQRSDAPPVNVETMYLAKPPPAVYNIVFGCSVFCLLGWMLLPKKSHFNANATRPASVLPIVDRADEERKSEPIQRSRSEYYKKRSKESRISETLKRRPHQKFRDGIHISPIHAAAEDGMAEWLHWVGEYDGYSLCQALDRNQQRPLHYAARAGQWDTCAVLLKYKANPGDEDRNFKTPLDLAREGGHEEVVKMLAKGPPGPYAKTQFRKKPSLTSQNNGICCN